MPSALTLHSPVDSAAQAVSSMLNQLPAEGSGGVNSPNHRMREEEGRPGLEQFSRSLCRRLPPLRPEPGTGAACELGNFPSCPGPERGDWEFTAD